MSNVDTNSSDINLVNGNPDIQEYRNNILVITSKNGVIYSNYGINNYENVIKLSILNPEREITKLRAYPYGKHQSLMTALSKISNQIIVYGGEKFVSNSHTLLGLIARANVQTDRLANIPIGEMLSNKDSIDSVKYNTIFGNSEPSIRDANRIIEKFNENSSKYNLLGALGFCIERFRYLSRIFTEDNFEKYKQKFNETNAELIRSLKTEMIRLRKNNIVKYIDNINKIDLVSKNVADEVSTLDIQTARKVRNLIFRVQNAADIAEYSIEEQFNTNKTDHILVKDNLLKYDGWEELVSENFRLVQIETLFSVPGQSYLEFLYNNNINIKELHSIDTLKIYAIESSVSKLIYNNNQLDILTSTAIMYEEQFAQLALSLARHGIYIVYTDNLRMWLMCNNSLSREKTLEIINEHINKTYIKDIEYRQHICDDCRCRKQFREYSDDNTIVL